MRSLRWSVTFVVWTSVSAAAQTPPMALTGQVDVAASTLGLMPQTGGALLPVAGSASIGASCSSQPVTHDSPIWSVVIWATALPAGGSLVSPGTSAYTLPGSPGHVFVPVVDTATISPVRVEVRDKVYPAAVTAQYGLLVLTFGPMTLSDIGDFLNGLEGSASVDMALRAATISAQLFDFVDPYVPTLRPDIFYADELLARLGSTPGAAAFSTTFGAGSPALPGPGKLPLPAPVVSPVTLKFMGLNPTTIPAARQTVKTLIGAGPSAPGSPIFLVDEPCLQFAVSPLVSGDGTSSTAVSFRARYDFYGGMGSHFAKLRVEGDGAPSGAYFQRVEGTLDVGFNRNAKRSVVSFSGSGSYSTTGDTGNRIDAWRAVVKTQLQAPSLVGSLGSLPGAATSPLLTLEVGGAGGRRLTGDEAGVIVRGTATFTGRFATRLYLDLRAVGAASRSAQFAGRDRYSYASAQIRFNVNKDWDSLIKYECGRKDPDFQEFCGGQSGLALTLGR